MKWIYWIVIIVVLMAIVFMACTKKPNKSEPEIGSIAVLSTPGGASIYLDDKYKGTTPDTLTGIPVGKYFIELKKYGYVDWQDSVLVEKNKTTYVTVSLLVAYGSIFVNSNPLDASIFLDDKYKGQTPDTLKSISTGMHLIELKKSNYADWRDSVLVESEKTTSVYVDLDILRGLIFVSSNPSGASIYLDSINTNKITPDTLFNVSVGWHKILLKLDGYADYNKHIYVHQDTLEVVEIDLKQLEGSLSVTSNPTDAEIWINDVWTGYTTPYIFSNLVVGTHYLKLTKEGYKDWTTEFTINENETTNINAELEYIPTKIVINSTPPGAAIWLDDVNTGKTSPDSLIDLSEGSHLIRLMLKDYFPWEDTVELSFGQTKKIIAIMDPAPLYKLAYAVEETLWVVGLDGLNPVKYADDVTYWNYLECSPDGKYLSYTSKNGITILEKDGTKKAEIPVSHATLIADHSWSHTGEELAIIPWCGGIYVYNLTTEKLDHIYRTHGCALNSPAFSPNDSVICYATHATTSAHIHLINRDGSNKHLVTKSLSTGWDEKLHPTWISSTEILYRANGWHDDEGIYLLDLETAGDSLAVPIRVVSDKISQIEISPNQQYYAYAGGYSKLCFERIGNWSPTELRNEHGMDDSWISWSPNSDAIAFRTTKSGIWWVLLDGTAYHIITYDWHSDGYTRFRGGISVTQ